MRKKRRKARLRKMTLTVLPVVVLLIALGAVMVWKVFVVKNVEVVGNEIYTDEQIEKWVLNDEYSWNSLYVYFDNKIHKTDEIPFVDSMEITLKSPQTVQIQVNEKGILGYVYIPSLGQNAYFDKDGFVVELSNQIIDGVTKISGLSLETAVLYEKLPLENSSILRTLLNVTQLLKKYDRVPDVILVDGSGVLLSYGDIQVNVGSGTSLNEKILRMDQIFPQLEGLTGTLHLETWTENSTDIYFKKEELTEIPNDVQVVQDESQTPQENEDDTEQ
jgi:cell division protein FtsQ